MELNYLTIELKPFPELENISRYAAYLGISESIEIKEEDVADHDHFIDHLSYLAKYYHEEDKAKFLTNFFNSEIATCLRSLVRRRQDTTLNVVLHYIRKGAPSYELRDFRSVPNVWNFTRCGEKSIWSFLDTQNCKNPFPNDDGRNVVSELTPEVFKTPGESIIHLYHATTANDACAIILNGIDLIKGNRFTEFARNNYFYLGLTYDHAKNFMNDEINRRPKKSCLPKAILRYTMEVKHLAGLAHLDLQEHQNRKQWLDFVHLCLCDDLNRKQKKEYDNSNQYEFIIGPIAMKDKEAKQHDWKPSQGLQFCIRRYTLASMMDLKLERVVFFSPSQSPSSSSLSPSLSSSSSSLSSSFFSSTKDEQEEKKKKGEKSQIRR